MGQVAVNWHDTVAAGTAARMPQETSSGNRYDLAMALRVIRKMETTATRGAVFSEIKNKNALYRLVDTLYSMASAKWARPLLMFAYMLKCALSVGRFDGIEHADAVSIASFDNEHHATARVAALVPDANILHLSIHRAHLFTRGQIPPLWQLATSASRVWPFVSRIARLHGFMPSARIASGLAYYMRFVELFAAQPGLHAAIVASNYSPEAMGMAAAAHRMNRRVIYINHAPVAANGPVVPPVLADCAVFYGDSIKQTYERRSRCRADVVLVGQPWDSRPMQWADEIRTVGIFLTALTRQEAVAELVAAIRHSHPDVNILIRNHPVTLLQTDFSALQARDSKIRVTIRTPLESEILACDLILCGNSGVAMNSLSGGRPVAYVSKLDSLAFDYNGFVQAGLVCPVEAWTADIYADLKRFYFNPKWHSVMRTYDAAYGVDRLELEHVAGQTIRRYLNPLSGLVPERFLAELIA